MLREPDRTPDGELLLGPSPRGRTRHPAIAGMAACSLALPVSDPKPISQVPPRDRCQRRQCKQYWQRERRSLTLAGDVEHVCPACFVERDKRTPACPNCASADNAIPEVLVA